MDYKFKKETKDASLVIVDGATTRKKKTLKNAVAIPSLAENPDLSGGGNSSDTIRLLATGVDLTIILSAENKVYIHDGADYVDATANGSEAICDQLRDTVLFKDGDGASATTPILGPDYNSLYTTDYSGVNALTGIGSYYIDEDIPRDVDGFIDIPLVKGDIIKYVGGTYTFVLVADAPAGTIIDVSGPADFIYKGVWIAAVEVGNGYRLNQIVSQGGINYVVKDITQFNGFGPEANTDAWLALPAEVNLGYVPLTTESLKTLNTAYEFSLKSPTSLADVLAVNRSANGGLISGVGTPNGDNDAANKVYVDSSISDALAQFAIDHGL